MRKSGKLCVCVCVFAQAAECELLGIVVSSWFPMPSTLAGAVNDTVFFSESLLWLGRDICSLCHKS